MPDNTVITVFGSSKPREGDEGYAIAHDLGRAIAEQGWTLCNGGYGGTMEAGARGAVEAGGKTIGVSCAAFGRDGVNRWVQDEIVTGDLNERLDKLIQLGQGYVVLPGSTGTLLELAAVWELTNKRFFRGKLIVLLGDYWQPVLDAVAQESSEPLACITHAATPDDAVRSLRDSMAI